jgi:hypothetical protein
MSARYPPPALACVMVMKVLAPIPRPATTNHAPTTFGRAPEANIAIPSVTPKTIAVANHAHGSSGAAIEKNTVAMSRSSTLPKRSRILVCSRSLS